MSQLLHAPTRRFDPRLQLGIGRAVMSLFHELKRRRVLRMSGSVHRRGRGGAAGADVLIEALRLPDWTLTLAAFCAILGLPIVVVLACSS